MAYTGTCFNNGNSGIFANKINQTTTSARYEQVHPTTGIQQLGRRLMTCRKERYDIRIEETLVQHITNDFHNGTIRAIGIASAFQHTSITRFQAEREHIECYIRTSLINDTNDTKRHTHLGKLHAIRTHRFTNGSSHRRWQESHIANAFGNAMNTFFGQLQTIVFRIVHIHASQVVGIGSQYLSGIVFGGIGQHQQYLIDLLHSASHQRTAGFADSFENFCHFSHTHSKYK